MDKPVATVHLDACPDALALDPSTTALIVVDIVLSDCTAEPIGSQFSRGNHEASLLVVETLFGWVSDSSSLLTALAPTPREETP